MTRNTVLALKEYIQLNIKEKIDFLAQIRKIEKMKPIVRSDYEKMLVSLAEG